MKWLVILLVLPMALAGDFAKMWAEVEKELQNKVSGSGPKGFGEEHKGFGEEHKGFGDEHKGLGEEHKGRGEEHKGWGEEHKGWGEEHNGWGEEHKRPGEEHKGSEEEHKGWGEEHKGWGGEHKGWGEEHKGWGESGEQKDQETDAKNNKTKSLYDEFKSWLAKQENSKKEEEEHKEYLRNNVEKFKEYMKMKQYKEMQEENAKEAIRKEMEKVQMKKLLSEKLYNVSNEYLAQKMKFTEDITKHFLEFCQCGPSKDLFNRLTNGEFGEADNMGMSFDYESEHNSAEDAHPNDTMPTYNSTVSGNHTRPNTTEDMNHELQETVKWFAKLSKKEQVKHVLGDLVKVMCTAASNYMDKMKHVEAALIEYKREHHMH